MSGKTQKKNVQKKVKSGICTICSQPRLPHTVHNAKQEVMFRIMPSDFICGGCRYAKMQGKVDQEDQQDWQDILDEADRLMGMKHNA